MRKGESEGAATLWVGYPTFEPSRAFGQPRPADLVGIYCTSDNTY